MKQKIKIMISCILVMAGIVFISNYLSKLVEVKSSYFKNGPFYEQKEDYDVLFLGTSHVVNGIYPMELWKDYGIVSYNLGGHGYRMETIYWVLKNALDYTTPQTVVIDCLGLSIDTKVVEQENFETLQHVSFDSMPLSFNKIRAIQDIMGNSDKKMDYLWKLSLYHSRWNEISSSSFLCDTNLTKGAELRVGIAQPKEYEPVFPAESFDDTRSVEYLRKMIEECQERKINVVLTYLPFPADEECQREILKMKEISHEYNVPYINFVDMNLVDFQTDLYDEDSHLNPIGAKKVTPYIGQILREDYNIADHKQDLTYKGWEKDYENYVDMKMQLLRDNLTLSQYILALENTECDIVLEIKKDSLLLKDEQIVNLFKCIGIDVNNFDLNENKMFILCNNKKSMYAIDKNSIQQYDFGEVGWFLGDGKEGVYLNGETCWEYNEESMPDVSIMTINPDNSEVINIAQYNYKINSERYDI